MGNRNIRERIICFISACVLMLTITITNFPSVVQAAGNQAAQDASTGVLQVNLLYRDDDNTNLAVYSGSGFLINSNTVITCAHVINLGDEDLNWIAELYNKSIAEVKDRLSYSVTVSRDVTIPATLTQSSEEMDWAILTLSQSIQNRSQLAIRSSATVQQTETVYAIGFPDESAQVQSINTYTSADATITSGIVNKVATGTNLYSGMNTDYIQTNVKLTAGNSGGPMVDENGCVIGICEGATGVTRADGTIEQDDYFYAIAIDQVVEVLDALGIQYTAADEGGVSEPETESVSVETEAVRETEAVPVVTADKTTLVALISECERLIAADYTTESYGALISAMNNAKMVNNAANATQSDVTAAVEVLNSAKGELKPADTGMSTTMIVMIAAAVVAVIIAVILVIVLSGKKKKAASQGAGSQTMPVTPPRPMQETVKSQGFAPVSQRPVVEAGETTTLKTGAGETTVLTKKVNGGTLISKRTGEKINITSEEFTIGRERTRVNYCVSGNTTVGRTHAKIVIRNGAAYLVDLNTTNGTYVNGVKCASMQEVPIKSGDKITLSDEEFVYQA